MKYLVITNGAYGELDWYRSRIKKFKKKIVADGAARRARELDQQRPPHVSVSP